MVAAKTFRMTVSRRNDLRWLCNRVGVTLVTHTGVTIDVTLTLVFLTKC